MVVEILNKEYLCYTPTSEEVSGKLDEKASGSNERFQIVQIFNGRPIVMRQFDTNFEKLVKSLPIGISGPIESEYGWHIFKVEE